MSETNELIVKRLEEFLPEGDFVAGIVAARFVDHMRANDPEVLALWLDEQAPNFIRELITGMSRARRSMTARTAPASDFAERAKRFTAGDTESLSVFRLESYVIDDENTRRPLGDMTGPDHLFVAGDYDGRARANSMRAEFHRAVAKKVGERRTRDVFTEAEFLAWRGSVGE